jgi:hypothetical protein
MGDHFLKILKDGSYKVSDEDGLPPPITYRYTTTTYFKKGELRSEQKKIYQAAVSTHDNGGRTGAIRRICPGRMPTDRYSSGALILIVISGLLGLISWGKFQLDDLGRPFFTRST